MSVNNEMLLSAWLKLSSTINNERIVRVLSFNEAYVCNLLYRKRCETPDTYLTATDLCNEMRMLKSQMNKVLTSLEKRGLIERFRSQVDRRMIYIRMREDNLYLYETEHRTILKLVDRAMELLGAEQTELTYAVLRKASECMDTALTESGLV